MEWLCGSFNVGFHRLCFSDRLCLFDYKYCMPYNLLDFTTDITMKRKKTRIHAHQIVVNNIDANIIVKQQRLIAEYERFNEWLLFALLGEYHRAVQFSEDIYLGEAIVDLVHRNIVKDGNTETEKV